MSRHVVLFLASFILISSNLNAQEHSGLKTENYAGLNSIFLNPAESYHSPLQWDINLMTGQLFFETDYALIRPTNLFHLLSYNGPVNTITIRNGVNDDVNSLSLVFDQTGGDKFASLSAAIYGPSAYFKLNDRMKMGFFTAMRVEGSAQNVHENFGYNELETQILNEELSLAPSNLNAMSWAEIGLHFSGKLDLPNYDRSAYGINVKYLNGFDAAFARNESPILLTKREDSTYEFNQSSLLLGYTDNNIDSTNYKLQTNGRGFGFDFGFNATSSNLKWGVSILDLGLISFKNNAQVHELRTDSIASIVSSDYSYDNLSQSIAQVSQDLNPGSNSLTADHFTLWLPLALSLQADLKLRKNLFVNAYMVQRIPLSKNMIARDNSLVITPRFESRFFSFMLPISLLDYDQLRLGAAARIAFLTVGSDKLGSLFGKSNFTGSDIYMSLRINPFRSHTQSSEVECFYFGGN